MLNDLDMVGDQEWLARTAGRGPVGFMEFWRMYGLDWHFIGGILLCVVVGVPFWWGVGKLVGKLLK